MFKSVKSLYLSLGLLSVSSLAFAQDFRPYNNYNSPLIVQAEEAEDSQAENIRDGEQDHIANHRHHHPHKPKPTPPTDPTPVSDPTSTAEPTPTPEPTSIVTPTSTSGSTAISTDTTAITCSGTAQIPVAPVTGYKLVTGKCDDFNNSAGSHFSGYNGGGSNTVVGAGRISGQCTYTNGQLIETQLANGATCGGSTDLSQKYGLWEVRMRAYSTGSDSGSQPHPVLILWPDTNNWPDGELDFFETDIGGQAKSYLHCIGNPQSNCFISPASSVDYSQYHVYSLLWTSTGMTAYIDGKQWWTQSGNSGSSFMPNVSMHLTIQLDNLSGATPVDPGVMEVDWIHMYSN